MQGSLCSLALALGLKLEGTPGLLHISHTPVWPSFWKSMERQVLKSHVLRKAETLRMEEGQLLEGWEWNETEGVQAAPLFSLESLLGCRGVFTWGNQRSSPSVPWLSALSVEPCVTVGSHLRGPTSCTLPSFIFLCSHPPILTSMVHVLQN